MEISWNFNASEKSLEFEIKGDSVAEEALLKLCVYSAPSLNYDYGTDRLRFYVRLNQE